MATNKPEIEPTLLFPCQFPIKVIGKLDSSVEDFALALIKQHCPDFNGDYERRPSRDGKYIALTFTVQANSKAQMDAIYQALSANPDVIMAL